MLCAPTASELKTYLKVYYRVSRVTVAVVICNYSLLLLTKGPIQENW